jgi:hypothetical protein
MERIIEKKGAFFTHRLRYGQAEESKFYVIPILFLFLIRSQNSEVK